MIRVSWNFIWNVAVMMIIFTVIDVFFSWLFDIARDPAWLHWLVAIGYCLAGKMEELQRGQRRF